MIKKNTMKNCLYGKVINIGELKDCEGSGGWKFKMRFWTIETCETYEQCAVFTSYNKDAEELTKKIGVGDYVKVMFNFRAREVGNSGVWCNSLVAWSVNKL